jgi:hypothetical protein
MTRTYVGHHERGDYGWVEIHSGELVYPLLRAGEHRPAGYHWGHDACDAAELADSLLSDALGSPAPRHLVTVFTQDIVAHLPCADFRIEEWEIHRWLAGRRPRTLTPDELVEHLGAIAIADPDEEAAGLRRLLDHCWDETTLCQ